MRESIKTLTKDMFSGLYFWVSFILVLFAIYDYFLRDKLPKEYQRYIKIPVEVILVLLMLVIILGAIKAYHKLRMTRWEELYKYLPEANKDRVFRVFYELHKEGEFLKQASVERRQRWDEQVLKEIRNYCKEEFISLYLLNTNRRFGLFTPLDDKYYDIALDHIKRILDQDFDLFVKY